MKGLGLDTGTPAKKKLILHFFLSFALKSVIFTDIIKYIETYIQLVMRKRKKTLKYYLFLNI